MTLKRWLIPVLMISVIPLNLSGQSQDKAQVSGVIQDEMGAFVPGVDLAVRGETTGSRRRTVSGATGRFLFPFLPPGVYTLRAELPGFAPLELREIHLTPNQTLDLPLVLEGGGRVMS